MIRVGFDVRAACHALQVEVFDGDEVVRPYERGRGLVLPVVDDAMRFRIQAGDLRLCAPVCAARMPFVFVHGFAGEFHSARLRLLTAANLPVDSGQMSFRQVDEPTVGRSERVRHATVEPDHAVRAFPLQRQWVVDEYECASCPVHTHARVVAYGLADADAYVDAVPARLPVEPVFPWVLSGDDHFAVAAVEFPVVRVRALVVPAHEIQIVTAAFEPWHHTRVPVLLTQGLPAFVRAPPVRVLDTVR